MGKETRGKFIFQCCPAKSRRGGSKSSWRGSLEEEEDKKRCGTSTHSVWIIMGIQSNSLHKLLVDKSKYNCWIPPQITALYIQSPRPDNNKKHKRHINKRHVSVNWTGPLAMGLRGDRPPRRRIRISADSGTTNHGLWGHPQSNK